MILRDLTPVLAAICLALPTQAAAGPAATARTAPAAKGTQVPSLSVERTCRQAEERQGPGLHTYEACLADEAAARQKLGAGLWQKAKADTRATCLANESVGDLASYIDLLTCVELFEGVVIRPADKQP